MAVSKVGNFSLRLRRHDFETGQCEYCRYFQEPTECKVLVGPVTEERVCDAFQGGENYEEYTVATKDIEAFGRGMRIAQPYQHKVVKMVETPVGWLVIIEDTMKPKKHRFSLDLDFHMEHTAREHHWTQGEVDRLVRIGKQA